MTAWEQYGSPARAGRTVMSVLGDSANIFETFFEASSVGLALADLSTRFVRVNAAYADLVGRLPEDLVGVAFSEQLHPGQTEEQRGRTSLLLTGQTSELRSEQCYERPDGAVCWVLHGVTVVRDGSGQPSWFAVSAQDITERHTAEDDLRELTATLAEQAIRDPLTGLANRMLLEERLRAVLARDGRTGASTGLLFLDLDGFKAVNDGHGHLVGDAVLRAVAQRLRSAVRPSDTVGRLGGDEFVVLVENAESEALQHLAERIHVAMRQPVVLSGQEMAVGVSIGVALSDGGRDDPGSLLARADRGMYAAKRAARQAQGLPGA